MNKKFMITGLVLMAGLITLAAFKTKEEQQQEIAAAIATQLDEFRAQKQEECTMRVNEEAQRRYQEYVASLPAPKPGKTTKARTSTSTKKDPMPQKAPTPAVQESQSKWNKNAPGGVQESQSKWQKDDPASKDAAPAPVQDSKSKWQKKPSGGGK